MSDVTVAQQGSAPPAAPSSAPPSNEVQINPNPTNTPTPVGSQAPPAPTPSRREAIQAAFDRANNPRQPSRHAPKDDAKPAPKAADAKPGHNQPPEATPAEKLDLKKRPSNSEQSNTPQSNAQSNGEQPRDRGRFAPRAQDPPAEAGGSHPNQQPGAPAKQLPPEAPFREPPTRMSDQAKAAWADTPETVRGEVHRQQQEFANAYKVYKGSFESMKPLWPYVKMAKEHGTTLEQALTNYTGMERKLRSDPIAGLDLIVHNLGLTGDDGQRITLRDIAYHVLSQTPDQLRTTQTSNNVQAAAHQIGALHQEVAGLKNALQQMHNQQQFTHTRSAVDQFAASHPRFDELGELVNAEIKHGYDLETAYRRAELLQPSTHAAQTRTTTTSAQTRTQDKSIHGSPDSPSNGARRERPRETSSSPREAITKAIGRVQGF